MEWLLLLIGLLIGAGAGGAMAWMALRRSSTPATIAPRWPTVLVPMLISEGSSMELPKAALSAACSLAAGGRVVFDLFIEVPRSHSLEAQMVLETGMSLELIEAAEKEARILGCAVESNIQKVRDYGYGVAEAVRQFGAKAVVLQAAVVQRSASQRGELGSSVRQPNTNTLITLIHDRAGCDVLMVG